MDQTTFKASSDTLKNVVELISKVALGTVALCYVLGLAVVNIYLNKYGVFALDLFRLNYISAGIWTLMPVVIAILVLMVFRMRSQVRRTTLLGYLLSLTPFLFVLAVSLRFKPSQFWILAIINGSFLAYMLIVATESVARNINTPQLGNYILMALLPTSLLLLSHTAIFANLVYGTIPSQIGGGRPKPVQLIVSEENENKKILIESGLSLVKNENQTDSNKSETVLLLFLTDQECIVLVKGGSNAISIRRDLIKTILYASG